MQRNQCQNIGHLVQALMYYGNMWLTKQKAVLSAAIVVT